MRRFLMCRGGLVVLSLVMGSCKDEETDSTTLPQGLTATPPAVSVGNGGSQNITITRGTAPYTTQVQNSALASAQVMVNSDTALIRITGVSTATGVTSVVVRDATTKSVGVTVTKVP